MKKTTIFLFLILAVIMVLNIEIKRDVSPVFNEGESESISPDDNFKIHKLDVSNINLTTLNFKDFFYNIGKDIVVYPEINKIYKKKLRDVYYRFPNDNIEYNIKKFHKYMSDIYKKNAFINEISKINIRGIKISRVDLYASSFEIKKLLENHPEIKVIE